MSVTYLLSVTWSSSLLKPHHYSLVCLTFGYSLTNTEKLKKTSRLKWTETVFLSLLLRSIHKAKQFLHRSAVTDDEQLSGFQHSAWISVQQVCPGSPQSFDQCWNWKFPFPPRVSFSHTYSSFSSIYTHWSSYRGIPGVGKCHGLKPTFSSFWIGCKTPWSSRSSRYSENSWKLLIHTCIHWFP